MPLKPIRISTCIPSSLGKIGLGTWVAVWLLIAGCNPDSTKVSPGIQDLGKLGTAVLVDTFSML
jgi:hypothetical protein